MANGDEEALALLTAQLAQTATNTDQAALEKISQTQLNIQKTQDESQARTQTRTITNATIAEDKRKNILGIVPSGSVPLTLKGVNTEINPDTGDTVITATPPAPNPSMQKVLATTVMAAAQPKSIKFDPVETFKKLDTMEGQELSAGILVTGAAINRQLAIEQSRIQKQAALDSGFTDALAAQQMHTQLALAKFGPTVMTIQMVEAQQRVHAAAVIKDNLEKDMLKTDVTVADLMNAQKMLNTLEQKRLNVEVQSAATSARMRETKNAELEQKRSLVTNAMVANYQALTGDTETNPDTVRDRIINTKDKNLQALTTMDPTNVYQFLTHPDGKIRNGAYKIVVESDKAINNFDSSLTETPLFKNLGPIGPDGKNMGFKAYIQDPTLIDRDVQKFLTDEQRKQYTAATVGLTTKEKEADRANIRAAGLQRIVEKKFEVMIPSNLNAWKTPETASASPLGQTIAAVASTNKDNKAPLDSVIASFISQEQKAADGHVMTFDEKQNILTAALTNSVNTIPPNYVLPDFGPITAKLNMQIKNSAARYEVQNKVLQFMEDRSKVESLLY